MITLHLSYFMCALDQPADQHLNFVCCIRHIFSCFNDLVFLHCSMNLVRFAVHPDALFCLVGVAKDLHLNPRSVSGGFLYTYRMTRPMAGQNGRMELVHKTVVDDVPQAICPFQGKVLIGVGKLLRLYDLGKKKLLRKSENKVRIPRSLYQDYIFSVKE
jgi:hypothetical protein